MHDSKPLVVFILGPTAAGKSALATALAEHYAGEIISVDSAQIYRGMDIGTAKPDAALRARIPHHLLDICDPAESYSAHRFREDALAAIDEVIARNKIPFLTGGTLLYFKTLLEPMADLPAADQAVRRWLDARWHEEGPAALQAELQQVDATAFARIDLNNPQRVIRALEVFYVSGRAISSFWAEGTHDGKGTLSAAALSHFPYHLRQFAVLPPDRAQLHQRIASRYQHMLEAGFKDEVEKLYQRDDLHLGLPSIRAVGYRQMWQYLDGYIDFDTMVGKAIAATRQLAKKQLTWLRDWAGLQVFPEVSTATVATAIAQCKNH